MKFIKDDRSIGELFYLSVDELPDVCIAQALRLPVSLFAKQLQEQPMCDEGKIQEQLEVFLSELPSLLSQKLRECARRMCFFSHKPMVFNA